MKVKESTAKLTWVATAEIENTGIYCDILRFWDPMDRIVCVAVPSSLMRKHRELAGTLADLGWQTSDQAAAVGAIQQLAGKPPTAKGVLIVTNGWLGPDADVFRCGPRAIAKKYNKILYIPTATGRADQTGKEPSSVQFVRHDAVGANGSTLAVKGTADSWSNNVGRKALKSSRVMTAICAPFAATLLRLLNIRPFGVCVYGETRDGKTTAEIAAASVIGIGTEQELPKWAMTEAAIHEACRVYNDLVLPLDDVALVPGNAKVKYQKVHDMAYRFSIGGQIQISTRGLKAMGELPPRADGYRSIIVTSSEKAIRELADEAGRERMRGEALRLIDLPSQRHGSAGVWDRLSADEAAGDLVDLGRKLSDDMKIACASHHGAPMVSFLERLVGDKDDALNAARKAIKTFKRLAATQAQDKQVQGVIEAFATLYAGGALALKFKVVPWTRDELREAVLTCCRDAISVLSDPTASSIDPLKVLCSILSDQTLVPTVNDTKQAVPQHAMGRAWSRGAEVVVEFLSVKLKEHPDLGKMHPALVQRLEHQGVLQRDSEGNSTHNIRWPGTGKMRVHRLVWPSRAAFDEWSNRLAEAGT
jgi:Domain of unknown function (DUF927)